MIVTKPADVLDVRSHLANFWSKPDAEVYTQGWTERKTTAQGMVWALRSMMNNGQCIYVPDYVVNSVWGLTDTHDPDFAVDVPAVPNGVAFLEEPILVTDVHGQVIAIRVICWMTSAEAIAVSYHQDVTIKDDLQIDIQKRFEERFGQPYENYDCDYPLFHFEIYPRGFSTKDVHKVDPDQAVRDMIAKYGEVSKVTGLRFEDTVRVSVAEVQSKLIAVLALWEHMGLHTEATIPRANARRAARALPKAPDGVRVLYLRSRTTMKGQEGAEVDWAYRWMVREHPRRAHTRRLKDGRVVPVRSAVVAAHDRGGKDKPIIDRPTVYIT